MKSTLTLLAFLIFSLSATLLLSSCSSRENQTVNETAALQEEPAAPVTSAKAEVKNKELIIRQAEVKIEVEDLTASTQRVEAMVEKTGATLSSTTLHEDDQAKSTDMIIKVRPEQFMPLLQGLQKEGVKLDTRTISTDDVAIEYVDLQARRNAKLAVEQRFLVLLKEAKNIQQILEVEHQIQAIREEIESAEARLRYLQNQTAYSTIRLSMYQVIPVVQPEAPGFGSRLLEAMNTGWQLLLSLIIGVFYLWPLWLIGLGVLFLLRRRNLAKI